jgi:hypothetical protein
MKSQFSHKCIQENIAVSEHHVQNIFQVMQQTDDKGWTNNFNLIDLFFRFSIDSSTEFLFGKSTNTQIEATPQRFCKEVFNTEAKSGTLEEAIKIGQKYMGTRTKLSKYYWMCDGFSYRRAVRRGAFHINNFLLECIGRAESNLEHDNNKPSTVIEALVDSGSSVDEIINNCRHLIVAGFDTTSNFLAFLFATVERHPHVFIKLQEEITSVFGSEKAPLQPITFAALEKCRYLQWVINETLRLYPVIPFLLRVANKDTVLPTGGGLDGKSPIAVAKGTSIQLGIYVCHQRQDIWGEDAAQFRPERWEGRKKDYSFIPFIGGPHVCIGRKYNAVQITQAKGVNNLTIKLEQFALTQGALLLTKFLMLFDAMEAPVGQNNLQRGLQSALVLKNHVKMRFRVRE